MKNLNNKDGNAIADVGIWKISWLFTNYKWYCLEGFTVFCKTMLKAFEFNGL